MTFDLPRRFPWPTLLSVVIHGSVIAGLLYTSVHQVIERPAPSQPIEITMVAPADLEPPQAAQPVVEPVVEPEPEPEPASPFENTNTAPARTAPSTSTATAKPTVTAPSGPRALSRGEPGYPARAQALRIEGNVRVKFDVTPDGRVDNVQILSAQPANMFEREVKNALRKWRYEPGKPGTGITMTIQFRLKGVQIS